MNQIVQEFCKKLEQGIVPNGLTYNINDEVHDINWDMVRYNSFYRSYDYAESKPKVLEMIKEYRKLISRKLHETTISTDPINIISEYTI